MSLGQKAGQILSGREFSEGVPENGRRLIQKFYLERLGMEKNQLVIHPFFVDVRNLDEVNAHGYLREFASRASCRPP